MTLPTSCNANAYFFTMSLPQHWSGTVHEISSPAIQEHVLVTWSSRPHVWHTKRSPSFISVQSAIFLLLSYQRSCTFERVLEDFHFGKRQACLALFRPKRSLEPEPVPIDFPSSLFISSWRIVKSGLFGRFSLHKSVWGGAKELNNERMNPKNIWFLAGWLTNFLMKRRFYLLLLDHILYHSPIDSLWQLLLGFSMMDTTAFCQWN